MLSIYVVYILGHSAFAPLQFAPSLTPQEMESVAASSGCEDLLQREQKVDTLEQLVALKQELVNLKQENVKLNQDNVNLAQKGDALGQAGATLVERANELKEASVDQLAREAQLVLKIKHKDNEIKRKDDEIEQLKEESVNQLFDEAELVLKIKRKDEEIKHKDNEIADLHLAEMKRKGEDELKDGNGEDFTSKRLCKFFHDELKELRSSLRALESREDQLQRQLRETAKDVEELGQKRKRRDNDLHAYCTNGDNHCLKRCRRLEAYCGLPSPSPGR